MFKKIFGNNKEKSEKSEKKVAKSNINWMPLTSVEQIEAIKKDSKDNYIGVFKHSTRCVISTTVLKRLESNFPENSNITMYYIDLLNYREVSAEVGYSFQVIHQSPQLLLIKNGEAVLNASHYDITEIDLSEYSK